MKEACKGKAEGVVGKLFDGPERVVRFVEGGAECLDGPCAMFRECVLRAVSHDQIRGAKPILIVGVGAGWIGSRIGS